MLGPAAGDLSFEPAFRKVRERAEAWGNAGAGLYLTISAYKVYIASCLSFLLQLAHLPAAWAEVEVQALRRLVRGPGHWASATDLKDLLSLGLPAEFPDMQRVSWAARPVARWEDGG